MKERIIAILKEGISLQERLFEDRLIACLERLVDLAIVSLKSGGKIIFFGNGGSAADAQHIAAELVGRFTLERKSLAALALTCNSSNLTCIANDYDFKYIFSRQIEGIGQKCDLAIGISTSGNSSNVLNAISAAQKIGMKTAALTGERNNQLAQLVDVAICVPSKNTARIQEAHITIGHIICELIEASLFS